MLPEWVDIRTNGRCKIIYGGFNPQWPAGKLEREIIDRLAEKLLLLHKDANIVIAVPNWYDQLDVIEEINKTNPEVVVICSLTDPLNDLTSYYEYFSNKLILVGYVEQGKQIDFWSIACLKFFKEYVIDDLQPLDFKYLYLNYNRKPHPHRKKLVRLLEQEQLVDCGCLTLGESKYTVGDKNNEFVNSGANDVIGDIGIPNDIYSLGRLDIWNTSFINVVSETQFKFDPYVFLSEKIYKPIIGLRPFIINGDPKIYFWLKRAGLDCFDDLFPVQLLEQSTDMNTSHMLIAETLQRYRQQDLMSLYNKIKSRLIYNRNQFYEYANSQQDYALNSLVL
jgi:hypothetical protein